MINIPHIRTIRTLAGVAVAALLCIVALSPPAGQAAGKTETLRFFSKPVSVTFTTADGTVSHRLPPGPAQAGDVFEIDSLDYAGTHMKHSKRPKGSDYLRCEFKSSPEPDCTGYAAIGSSLLRFRGMDLVGAIGRWKSGKVLSNKEVEGGSDIVLKLRRN
ncbi:MAG: hypothetical protein ACXWZP_09170 [Gaiellaceae bacterium]